VIPRKYNRSDKDRMINLFRLNTPRYFSTSEEAALIYYLDRFAEHYYVIEENEKLIGGGGINFSEDLTLARISWDILDPEHQGKGKGSSLLQFRMEKIREIKTVKQITVRTSQLVFKFYEKAGFILQETIKDYWAPGFDLYRMEYIISPNRI